jgi:hypothetical protein
MSTANDLANDVRNEFLQKNSNLLALTRNGANDIMKRLSASLALDKQSQDEVLFYADAEYLDQKNYVARKDARETFKRCMYEAICRAFLKVQRNHKIEYVSKLTSEADRELEAIEIAAGYRLPAPLPPPQKSTRELLEEEVIADYNGALSVDKMRVKFNSNKAYRDMFNLLSESGRLESRVTSFHDGREV